jgi:hypothetical protein
MSSEDKLAERTSLVYQLGLLLGPLEDLIKQSPPPSLDSYRVTLARFIKDFEGWSDAASRFVEVRGVRFHLELKDILRQTVKLRKELEGLIRHSELDNDVRKTTLKGNLECYRTEILDAIGRVPIAYEPKLLDAQTPFDTYLRIGDVIGRATRRIHYFDRYLDSDFFPLYLRGVDRSLEIRLVTTHGNSNYGIVNVSSVSNLAAQEFTDFQLIECNPTELHDRNLRIDDDIFHLGPSMTQAGNKPTNFVPADSTPQAHKILDTILFKGRVVT